MYNLQGRQFVGGVKRIVRAVRRVINVLLDRIVGRHAKLFRKGPFIRERFIGKDPNLGSKHFAVYVNFDIDGAVQDYVLHQLGELVQAGYRIVFVSNSPIFAEHSRIELLPFCAELIWRFNVGYDFGAYKDGISSLKFLSDMESLILMNDSVYGPFWHLEETLAEIDRSNIDFWGVSDSHESQYHLQSFFLLFFRPAFTSIAFADFWRSLPYVTHKQWVIRNAELKLTEKLARSGLRSGVLAPYDSAASIARHALSKLPNRDLPIEVRRFESTVSSGTPVNPMHFFWDILIRDFRCPFIKRELIRSNPAKIPMATKWREVIKLESNYDISLIERHSRR